MCFLPQEIFENTRGFVFTVIVSLLLFRNTLVLTAGFDCLDMALCSTKRRDLRLVNNQDGCREALVELADESTCCNASLREPSAI